MVVALAACGGATPDGPVGAASTIDGATTVLDDGGGTAPPDTMPTIGTVTGTRDPAAEQLEADAHAYAFPSPDEFAAQGFIRADSVADAFAATGLAERTLGPDYGEPAAYWVVSDIHPDYPVVTLVYVDAPLGRVDVVINGIENPYYDERSFAVFAEEHADVATPFAVADGSPAYFSTQSTLVHHLRLMPRDERVNATAWGAPGVVTLDIAREMAEQLAVGRTG